MNKQDAEKIARATAQSIEPVDFGSMVAMKLSSEAILAAYKQGVEESAKVAEKLDPLLSLSSWEDGDDIAEGVRRYVAKEICKLSEGL